MIGDLLADARAHVAGILTDLGVPVHAYPPASISPPAVAIVPGFPYVQGDYLAGTTLTVGLLVQIVTVIAAAPSMDTLIQKVAQTLAGAGITLEPVRPPIPNLDTGTLIAQIPVTLTWKD